MVKDFPVRYGSMYKIVLAIVLPCFLTIPFIQLMQPYKHMAEWKMMLIIFLFLAALTCIVWWIIIRVYPATILRIDNNVISLSFDKGNPFAPGDFSFNTEDIVSLTRQEIGIDEYFVFRTEGPVRRFQISAASGKWEDSVLFCEAMEEIAAKVSNSEKSKS